MFVFKFQQVLDYRKNVEEKILHEFSDNKRRLESEVLKLQTLIEERTSLIGELKKMQNVPVPAGNIARCVSYIERIREDEAKQKQIIDQVNKQLEAKRRELLEAVKKRKVMEKLKERHTEEFEKNMRDLEQKNSDEMAVLRFGWREK